MAAPLKSASLGLRPLPPRVEASSRWHRQPVDPIERGVKRSLNAGISSKSFQGSCGLYARRQKTIVPSVPTCQDFNFNWQEIVNGLGFFKRPGGAITVIAAPSR